MDGTLFIFEVDIPQLEGKPNSHNGNVFFQRVYRRVVTSSFMDVLAGRGDVTGGEEVLRLAKDFKHPRDDEIVFFEAAHIYEVRGKKLPSVTGLVKKPFGKFDPDAASRRILKRLLVEDPNFPVPEVLSVSEKEGLCPNAEHPPLHFRNPRTRSDVSYVKYMREKKVRDKKSAREAIRGVWEQSTQAGTSLHRAIELVLNGEMKMIPGDYRDIEFRTYFLRDFYEGYFKQNGFVPYRTEWVIWSSEIPLAGSVDAVVRRWNKTEKEWEYYIFDWKRSKKIYRKSFEKNGRLKGKMEPFDELNDCNYSAYCLQLNVYRRMLEQSYGIRIKGMSLFIFHPWNSTYVQIEVPRMEKHTQALFKIGCPQIHVLIPESFVSPSGLANAIQDAIPLWKNGILPAVLEKAKREHRLFSNVQINSLPSITNPCISTREVVNLGRIEGTIQWDVQLHPNMILMEKISSPAHKKSKVYESGSP